MSGSDSPWDAEEFERRSLARLLAAGLTEREYEEERRCIAEIRTDPLGRGQPQETTDWYELGVDDPPPSLVLYWARVSPRTNRGVFYIVDTEQMRIEFANL